MSELESHVMLFFTGISRSAAQVAVAQVQSMPERTREMERIRELVDEGLDVLQNGSDIREFGQLLHEGWLMKRSLSHAISTTFIDDAYEAARGCGAIGGKLLGAGGGGFLMLFAPPELQPRIKEALGALLHVPVEFEYPGSQIIFHDPESDAAGRRSVLEAVARLDNSSRVRAAAP
jgi:D-glycero-alpha-D-manno-heptose-7-phosphate kinase